MSISASRSKGDGHISLYIETELSHQNRDVNAYIEHDNEGITLGQGVPATGGAVRPLIIVDASTSA
jgi:hypothetical protein